MSSTRSISAAGAPPNLDLSDPGLPEALRASLSSGRPITVAARNSTAGGAKAYDYAATDLHEAVRALAGLGIDVTGALPSKTEIVSDLAGAKPIRSTSLDGGTLTHRIIEYDRRAEWGVVFVVGAGTGKSLDENAEQPWVSRLGATMRHCNTALLFAKERHRIARNAWAAGPAIAWLEATGGWIGSAERGLIEIDSMTSLMLFFDLAAAQEQGRKIPIESRRGMSARTAKAMVGGRVAVGVGHSAPPGFCIVRLKSATGKGGQLMCLDSPGYLPADAECAYGLPEAMTAEGKPADQVAAVKWVLANAFQPGVRLIDLVRELQMRGFSTQRLRRLRNDNGVTLRDLDDSNALGVLRALFRQLDVYRSGEVTFRLGSDSVEDLVISGCAPPGGWASDEDFERIEQGLRSRPARSHHLYAFAGLEVTIGTDTYVLRSRSRGVEDRLSEVTPAYYFQPTGETTSRPGYSIPHAEIASWILGGIENAGDRSLSLFAGEVSSSAIVELTATLARLESEQRQLEERERRLIEQLDRASGALFDRLQEEYNNNIGPRLQSIAADTARTRAQIDDARSNALSSGSHVAAERLLELVESLGDPTDGSFREVLIPSIRDAAYIQDVSTWRGIRRVTHRLTGTLIAGTGAVHVELPLDHTWDTGASANIEARIPEILEELRSGTAFADLTTPLAQYSRSDLAAALGVPGEELLLPRILDGRISRAVTHLVYTRDGRSLEQIALDVNEPLSFIERIAGVYLEATPPPRWQRGVLRYLVSLYASADRNGGLARLDDLRAWGCAKRARVTSTVKEANDGFELEHGKGYRLRPCEHCGSTRLYPMTIREPDGPVCATCRRDRRGLVWPANPYDRYIAEVGIWAIAGSDTGRLSSTAPQASTAQPSVTSATPSVDKIPAES